jgi:hypothetical protein
VSINVCPLGRRLSISLTSKTPLEGKSSTLILPPLSAFFLQVQNLRTKLVLTFSVLYGEQKMDLPMAGLCLASAAIAAVAGIPPGTCFAVAVCVVFNSAMVLVTRGVARAGL